MRTDRGLADPCRRSRAAPCRVARATAWVGLLLAIPAPSGAQECPCATPSIEQAVAQASVILVGKILSLTSEPATGEVVKQGGQWRRAGDAASIVRVMMQVDAAAKAPVEKLVAISTPDPCGTPFSVGETYLVFATQSSGGLWTDACRGNASGAAVPGRLEEVRALLTKPER